MFKTMSKSMSKFASMLAVSLVPAALIIACTAMAQNAVPDLRGTWKGESESIVLGGGNAPASRSCAQLPSRSRSTGRTGVAFLELFHRRAAARKLSP